MLHNENFCSVTVMHFVQIADNYIIGTAKKDQIAKKKSNSKLKDCCIRETFANVSEIKSLTLFVLGVSYVPNI